MTIDWVSIALAIASALITALIHQRATSTAGGLASARPTSNSATGHPVLDTIVNTLQGVVAQNPQILTSLNGVLVQLQHPGGTTNLNLTNTPNPGGTTNPPPQPQAPVAVGPAAFAPTSTGS